MQALAVAIVGKIVEVLAKVLLIPYIQEWRKNRQIEKDNKKLEKENKAKGNAYENSSPDTAHDEFRKLP